MLGPVHAELVSKYSFIEKAEIKGAELHIIYLVKGIQKVRKVPRRVTNDQLLKIINTIKQEIGVSKYGKGYNSDIYITA